MPSKTDTRTNADILSSVEQVMNETIPDRSSRRSLMTRAGGVLAAGAALTLPGAATADAATGTEGDVVPAKTEGVVERHAFTVG